MAAEAGVTVRPGRPADLAAVAGQYGSAGRSPWDPFTSAERLARIPLEGLLVAEKDGTYAGFLYWFEGRKPWFDRGADRYAQLEELRVRPEFQGWGVAQRLLDRFLKEVTARGIPLLYVAADETNQAAQHLYQTAGFQPFLRTTHFRRYT